MIQDCDSPLQLRLFRPDTNEHLLESAPNISPTASELIRVYGHFRTQLDGRGAEAIETEGGPDMTINLAAE